MLNGGDYIFRTDTNRILKFKKKSLLGQIIAETPEKSIEYFSEKKIIELKNLSFDKICRIEKDGNYSEDFLDGLIDWMAYNHITKM